MKRDKFPFFILSINLYPYRLLMILVILIFVYLLPKNSNAQPMQRHQVITAYIYRFANNIEWQNEEAITEFQFLIIGEDKEVLNEMKTLSNTKTLRGKPINIVSKRSLDIIDDVHLIYITKEQEHSLTELFDKIEGKNILLISDGFQDKRLVMINFIEGENENIHFEINKANIINQNFRLMDDLVLFGGTEIDVAALYREGQQSLRSLQKHTDNLENNLLQLEHTITSKTQEMQIQKDRFDRQILAQHDSLIKQTLKIQEQQTMLSDQLQSLEKKQINIRRQDREILKQQNILDEQSRESEKQKEELNKGTELLQKQKEQILSQTKILEGKTVKIDQQQRFLYLLIIIITLVIILVFLIYNRYKSKQKLNTILESKVEERTIELRQTNEKLLAELSHRKLAEEALHKYEHIVSSSTDMLAFIDKQYTYRAANKEYMKAFDLTTEKLIGKTVGEVFGEIFFNMVIKPHADRCLGGEEINYQDWFDFPSTGKQYMDINYHPYYADDKQILGFVVNGRNITDRKQIEDELIESNEKYLDLMDSLGTGVILHAADTSILLSNPMASEILGISAEQMKGKKAIDPRWRFVKNDGTDMPLEEYPVNKALSLMESFSEYFIGIKRPDRKYITWVNVNASLVYDEYKKIKYVTISFNDTTEQKQAELALKESEERFKGLMKQSPFSIQILDTSGVTTLVNSAFENLWGLKIEDLKDYNMLQDEQLIKLKIMPFIKKAFAGEAVIIPTSEYDVKDTFGKSFKKWVQAHVYPIKDSIGKIVNVILVHEDITERKQAEEALQESEAKLNALFTSLTEMVVMHELVLNVDGEAIDYRIIDCNTVFTEFTGIRKEDAIGKLASEVYQSNPPPYLEKYAKVALGGDPYEFNTFYPPLDKHFMISVVSPQAGKFATITTDISDMMQIQDMIIAKNKEMENYLYVASHDLRTPLVNIQGFSQRLKKQADSIKSLFADKTLEPEILHQLATITDENIPKTLSFILSNIEKMDTLINGLLQLSRTGTVKMNIQEIDMNALFANILQSLDFQIKEAQCKIHIDSLPECYGDAALLDQLFANIISNALKYADSERALEITVDAKKTHNKLVYSIRDTGKGIAQKHLDKIWDVFYRTDPRSGKTGEGIGLSLVKRIAEKHKGKVWAESEENKGSVFHIELQNRSFTEI